MTAVDSANTWGCLNSNGLCDADNVPDRTDRKESHFSWVYNEYGSGNMGYGFAANTTCQCLIKYNNCTDKPTTEPTANTAVASTNPTTEPSTPPTLALTRYQFDDLMISVKLQDNNHVTVINLLLLREMNAIQIIPR